MKIYFVLFAAIALLSFGCKKEVREIKTTNETATAARVPLCTGNNWELDNILKKGSISLVYNNKVYVFYSQVDAIHIYDGTSWSSKLSNMPFELLPPNFGFTIGTKGYLTNFITGGSPAFKEYNFVTNQWADKAILPVQGIDGYTASSFSIGNKGYVIGGIIPGTANRNEIWEYNPASNTWTQKASFPQIGRGGATGFSIGNKGYIVGGTVRFPNGNIYLNELLEYDPATDSWKAKADFPGENRVHPSVFVISGAAYVGGGSNNENSSFKDFYKYTPETDSWSKVADSPILDKHRSHYAFTGFALNSKGYAVFYEPNPANSTKFMLKYNPRICIDPIPTNNNIQ